MALRGQPYIPLYVMDFLTDEKLNECSALATGVCIKVMCLMHKSNDYGKIFLKQKDKGDNSVLLNFSNKLSRQLPWDIGTIENGLEELVNEDVMQIDGDYLIQKRMVKDNKLSLTRAKSGKKGGKKKRIPQNASGDK